MLRSAPGPRFALLVLLAWSLAALQLVWQFWPETAATLLDTDDAMRLVQMRGLLEGRGWFALHEPRVQPPLGYDSHWSRLIDLGLAGLYLAFRPFVGAELAERLMRTLWPLLWLLPVILGAAAIAWRLAGREAALLVLLFAVAGFPAYQQFKPGRIDHHNVQIAVVLLVVAATAWADRSQIGAVAAGLLTGAGLAIGLEGAPLLGLCGGLLALRFVRTAAGAQALARYGLALAAGTAAAFLLSVAPERWGARACDGLAINIATPAVLGGLALFAASLRPPSTTMLRVGRIAAVVLLVGASSLILEPRCLRGPYALVDPAVRAIWLDRVREMQPLLAVFAANPLTALGLATFPVLAALAALVLMFAGSRRGDHGILVAAAVLLLAVATMVAAIKAYSYAMWLGMPVVAAAVVALWRRLALTAAPARAAAAVLVSPFVLSAGAIGLADAAGLADTQDFSRPERQHCFRTAAYAPLAALPPGLVAADVDHGPFLLALTPHAVLAAPYHRLSHGILAVHRLLQAPPDTARAMAAALGVDYIAVCGPGGAPGGLRDALVLRRPPDWLVPVGGSEDAFAVYRVMR